MKQSSGKLSLTIVPGSRDSPAPEPRTLSAQRNSASRLPASSPATMSDEHSYVRALFSYDPSSDSWAPCPGGAWEEPFRFGDVVVALVNPIITLIVHFYHFISGGLAFAVGDVLRILRRDGDWWQAENTRRPGDVGLIPSDLVEER